MSKSRHSAGKFGIFLCSSMLLAHPGCAGPGLPGLPRPPGLGQMESPKPSATSGVAVTDAGASQHAAASLVRN